MSSFTKHPPLQPFLDGKRWKVFQAFEFYFDLLGVRHVVRVAKDFISDGASIPRIFWSLIGGPWGKYGYAAIVHDCCYRYGLYNRAICDLAFLKAMKVLKVNRFKRWIMYQAVRLCGWRAWNRYRKSEEVK